MNFGQVIFGQVTDIQKVMHMSPPCIRTGGLKGGLKNYLNCCEILYNCQITDKLDIKCKK